MTLKLNLCKITDGQFRWKGEEILLFLLQNLLLIFSFDSFTPWERAVGGDALQGSTRNFSSFSDFLAGHSWQLRCQDKMLVLLSIHPTGQDNTVPSILASEGIPKNAWQPPECTL